MARGALRSCGHICVRAAQFLLLLSNPNIRILVTMVSHAKTSLGCVETLTGVYYLLPASVSNSSKV